jgi:MFS family permease
MKKLIADPALDVLRIRDFRLFLLFRFFLTSASLMQAVIVGWHIYSLTNDVLSLGMIGLTEVIPQISIALIAGYFVDRWDRKKIITYASTLLILGSLLLVIYSLPGIDGYRLFRTAPIFVTIFITGLVRGILMPAHTALLGQLVPRKQLASAATWSSINWHVAAVSGPAIGGLVYGFFGVVAAYSGIFLFYVLAFFLIFKIKIGSTLRQNSRKENIFRGISEGIRFVFSNQVLLGAFTLDMFAVFFGGAVAVLPVFASDVLNTGPQGLGILRASPAIGSLLMSAYLAFRPPVKHTGVYLIAGVAGFGISMVGFALSENFYLSMVFLFLSGAFDNVSVVIRASILQLYTPDEMKGRVASINSIFVGSSNELGAFESGVAARLMGLVPSVVFGGIMTLLVVITTGIGMPRLRKISFRDVFNQMT